MMMNIEIDSQWLIDRVTQETNNIRAKKMNRLQYMLTSKKQIQDNLESATKSGAIVEFIGELFQNYEAELRIKNSHSPTPEK